MSETLLSVRDLKVHFDMRVGGIFVGRYQPLKAVDGVSFDLKAGETLGCRSPRTKRTPADWPYTGQ